jgi:hypothetical protein
MFHHVNSLILTTRNYTNFARISFDTEVLAFPWYICRPNISISHYVFDPGYLSDLNESNLFIT